jgi:hypothetical protein
MKVLLLLSFLHKSSYSQRHCGEMEQSGMENGESILGTSTMEYKVCLVLLSGVKRAQFSTGIP